MRPVNAAATDTLPFSQNHGDFCIKFMIKHFLLPDQFTLWTVYLSTTSCFLGSNHSSTAKDSPLIFLLAHYLDKSICSQILGIGLKPLNPAHKACGLEILETHIYSYPILTAYSQKFLQSEYLNSFVSQMHQKSVCSLFLMFFFSLCIVHNGVNLFIFLAYPISQSIFFLFIGKYFTKIPANSQVLSF